MAEPPTPDGVRGRRPETAAAGMGGADLFRLAAKVLLLAAALVVALWFLHTVQRALLVLVVAAIVAVVLNAAVCWLEERGVRRTVGTAAVFVAVLAVIGALGWLVLPPLVREVPRLLDQLPQLLSGLVERLGSLFGAGPVAEERLSQAADSASGAVQSLVPGAPTLISVLLLGIVVLALVFYALLDPRPLLATSIRLLPEHLREPATRALSHASEMIVGWAASVAILGTVRGVATYLFLLWMGVPGALLWGVLAFASAPIPQVGFYIMAIPPVMVAVSQSMTTALWTTLFFIVSSQILGNFVAPRIRAQTMRLHPAYILAVTLLMAFAFGILGVLIAPPVAAIVKAFVMELYLPRRSEDPRLDERASAILARSAHHREP